MKRYFIIIPILCTGIIVYSILGYLKGIEVTFLDKNTKEPIGNLLVYYQINLIRTDYLKLGTESRILEERKLVTDKNGKIYLNNRLFIKYPTEKLLSEIFIINLDTIEKEYYDWGLNKYMTKESNPAKNFFSNHDYFNLNIKDKDKIITNLKNYLGYVLVSSYNVNYADINSKGCKTVKTEKYTLFWNDYGLKNRNGKITILLDRVQ